MLLTVPAGRTWLVKCITVANESGIAGTLEVTLNSSSAGVNRLHRVPVPGDSTAHIVLPMVFNAADTLRVFGATGAIRCVAFGADLTA